MRSGHRILIIVPAYNEEESIVRVIADLVALPTPADVLVVNDGSCDRTSERARQTGKARVVDLACNLGIGGAVQTGLLFAVRHGYDTAIQFDGDGQHRAEEIPRLLSSLDAGGADVLIGSRFCESRTGFKSTAVRRVGIRLFGLVTALVTGQRITDCTSGFRAYNRRAIEFLAQRYPGDFPEPETIVLLGRNGFRMKEVFCTMQPRQGGRSSIGAMRSVYYMIKVLLAILMNALRLPAKQENR